MLGKLNPQQLRENVLSLLSKKRDEVKVSAGISEDCAVFQSDKLLFATADPITSADKNAGGLAITVCANDLASCGADPFAAMLIVLAPVHCDEKDIKTVMTDAERQAKKLNIDIVGGHTEFTDAVNRIIVSAFAVGQADEMISSHKVEPGDSLIVTKHLAIEGTAILAHDFKDRLNLSEEEMKFAGQLMESISVVEEGRVGSKLKVRSMHDITEGGVFGAVAEMFEANGLGAELYADKFPFLPLTEKICSTLGLDKNKLLSSGSMMIVSDKPQQVLDALNAKGILATEIGKVTDSGKAVCIKDGKEIPLKVERDEINKMFERK